MHAKAVPLVSFSWTVYPQAGPQKPSLVALNAVPEFWNGNQHDWPHRMGRPSGTQVVWDFEPPSFGPVWEAQFEELCVHCAVPNAFKSPPLHCHSVKRSWKLESQVAKLWLNPRREALKGGFSHFRALLRGRFCDLNGCPGRNRFACPDVRDTMDLDPHRIGRLSRSRANTQVWRFLLAHRQRRSAIARWKVITLATPEPELESPTMHSSHKVKRIDERTPSKRGRDLDRGSPSVDQG
ncbi:uncharacterized protein BJX67DRAFT_267582 [Aspergillus lucknowensis]|uniref:Uncharacterized protein n=1 Tax=Aspergillus lucknowensis TaxID=176173 RepID=A0ABR4LF12_9EURO